MKVSLFILAHKIKFDTKVNMNRLDLIRENPMIRDWWNSLISVLEPSNNASERKRACRYIYGLHFRDFMKVGGGSAL